MILIMLILLKLIKLIELISYMKSSEKAYRTYHHTRNNSTAKYQFSFGREKRFNRRADSIYTLDKFYEIPSQLVKRAHIFSRAKRDFQK